MHARGWLRNRRRRGRRRWRRLVAGSGRRVADAGTAHDATVGRRCYRASTQDGGCGDHTDPRDSGLAGLRDRDRHKGARNASGGRGRPMPAFPAHGARRYPCRRKARPRRERPSHRNRHRDAATRRHDASGPGVRSPWGLACLAHPPRGKPRSAAAALSDHRPISRRRRHQASQCRAPHSRRKRARRALIHASPDDPKCLSSEPAAPMGLLVKLVWSADVGKSAAWATADAAGDQSTGQSPLLDGAAAFASTFFSFLFLFLFSSSR